MKIFVAGGTGAVGKQLVPLLVRRGHRVFATTRRPEKTAGLRAAGAEPIVVDGLDREGLLHAVVSARPHVVVHEMTAFSGVTSLKNLDRTLAISNPCGPRVPSTCSRRPASRGRGGSWRRASPAGPTPGRGEG
jgi:nucleoside-diphosphate-sugar epimerase